MVEIGELYDCWNLRGHKRTSKIWLVLERLSAVTPKVDKRERRMMMIHQIFDQNIPAESRGGTPRTRNEKMAPLPTTAKRSRMSLPWEQGPGADQTPVGFD